MHLCRHLSRCRAGLHDIRRDRAVVLFRRRNSRTCSNPMEGNHEQEPRDNHRCARDRIPGIADIRASRRIDQRAIQVPQLGPRGRRVPSACSADAAARAGKQIVRHHVVLFFVGEKHDAEALRSGRGRHRNSDLRVGRTRADPEWGRAPAEVRRAHGAYRPADVSAEHPFRAAQMRL
jgi:hypothetical protein